MPMVRLLPERLKNAFSRAMHYSFVCFKMVRMGKRTREELRSDRQHLLYLESDGFVNF